MLRDSRVHKVLPAFAVSALLVVVGYPMAWGQDALTAKLLPQGAVQIMSGGKLLATLSLNAHGPEWKHADQSQATATVRPAAEGPAKVVQGTLPVPNTEGGAIRFVETVGPAEGGLAVDYVLGVTKALTLNGLQVSVLLPTATFAGKTVAVHPMVEQAEEAQEDAEEQEGAAEEGAEEAAEEAAGAGEDPEEKTGEAMVQTIVLPEKLDAQKWQLFVGPASKIQVAPGTENAITVTAKPEGPREGEPAPPPMFVIQDQRQWEQDLFEVRLFLIMDDKGRRVSAWDKLHMALGLNFARELRWE